MSDIRFVVLSGGVGGAKLVLGLSQLVPGENLVVVTNTADDFEHLGMRICPDTDTVVYTLAGLSDPSQGWGRANESWNFMASLKQLGGEDWFNLGDQDLALHLHRTSLLNKGYDLSKVTAKIARALDIKAEVLPMCNEPVETMVNTSEGQLPFQKYFVEQQCEPSVTGFEFAGIEAARPNPKLLEVLQERPAAIVIAPSNPFVSVDPILSVPGLKDEFKKCGAPIVAVSPIIGGQAIKGPASKMMSELGLSSSATGVARHYQGFVDLMIIDEKDSAQASEIEKLGMEVKITQTFMQSLEDRVNLAGFILNQVAKLKEEALP